jgi:wyosine [tRNA(Phe)-imidazoG37] synthetase (radical SAM superfamily)
MPVTTPLFTSHSRNWQQNRYVYPVISRRSHGLSIGINLNPDKACNFDCIYCSVDRRNEPAAPPTRSIDLVMLRLELDVMLSAVQSGHWWTQAPFNATPVALQRLNDVAFSGDGEPTACPQFAQACSLVGDVLAWHHLDALTIVVITNATLLDRPEVVQALHYLDGVHGEVWAKLDAGTQEYYALVDRTKVPLRRVLDNLIAAGRLRPLVIQSLFMRIDGEAPSAHEISAYLQRLAEVRTAGGAIRLVQVYTVARQTAERSVTPLLPPQLDAIADGVRALGIAVETFYGPP